VIRRAHDRVRGLTFSQLQPIAEGIGPASLQYSPPPLPSPPPERTEGGKGRKGKGRRKWVHGSDCSASRHPSTIHRRISLRNARPERTSGLSRIARCRALFSPVTEVAKLPGLPSPPPRPSQWEPLWRADSYLRGIIIPTVSPADRPPRRVAPTYFPTCNIITGEGENPRSAPSLVRATLGRALARNSVHVAPTPESLEFAGILLKLSSSFDAETCDVNRTRKE